MKTIHNTYVKLESKEQFNRLIEACKEKGLKTDEYQKSKYFHGNNENRFCDWHVELLMHKKVTETKFLKLLENETI
jgi:hypothetical protein